MIQVILFSVRFVQILYYCIISMSETNRLLPDESLTLKMKKKWLRLYILSFVVLPCSYVIKVLVSRELSVWDVGIVYSLLWFIGMISIYNDLWLTDALQYYIPKYTVADQIKKIRWILWLTVILQFCSALLIWSFLFFFAPRLAINHFDSPEIIPLLKQFGRYFMILNLFQVTQSLYFSLQDVKIEKWLELLRMLIVMWCVLIFWYLWYLSLISFTFSWFIGLIGALIGTIIIMKKYGYIDYFLGERLVLKEDVFKWLSYGFWSLIGANAWTIISQIDLQLIISLVGKEAAGYWTNYLSLTSLMIFIFVPLLSFCFPVFTEYIEKKQYATVRRARIILLWAIVLYAIVLWIIWTLYGSDIAVLVFGEQYLPTGTMVVMSAFLLCTPLLWIVNFQYIRSYGEVRWVSVAQVLVLIIHILVSHRLLTSWYSYMYLWIILHISHLLFYVVTERYVQKNIHNLPTNK